MKKNETAVSGETEILGFEDVRKALDSKKQAVQDVMAKRKNLLEGIEEQRSKIIFLDRDICEFQDRLNDELIKNGKVSEKITDQLQTLRAKRENIEANIISLSTEALPKTDEQIRLAQNEMNKTFELALDELRPVYSARINGRYAGIDMDCEEWLSGVQSIINENGVSLGSIDKMRVLRLRGIKLNSDLISRIT